MSLDGLVTGLRQFWRDDRAQDLMEYALLSLFLGLAGLAAFNAIGVAVHNWYGASNTSVNGLSTSPAPGS